MFNEHFTNYGLKFPDIILEIFEYFDAANEVPDKPDNKTVLKFCQQHQKNGESTLTYKPQVVTQICKRLCELGYMNIVRTNSIMGLQDNYFVPLRDAFRANPECLKYYLNSRVFGFHYIYQLYKDIVLPLIGMTEDGDFTIGTGFKYENGIVTAKHCIKDVKSLQIKGYKASDLKDKPIYISENEGVDIAFIETGRVNPLKIFYEDGEILQEVLVLGYPKIPAFDSFLTVEKGTISSMAEGRFAPTRGCIAACEYDFLMKTDAILITAKIKGGNSGGPIINENGCLVGVACGIPDNDKANGNYDDLGYGIVLPFKYVREIINKKANKLQKDDGFFQDYE